MLKVPQYLREMYADYYRLHDAHERAISLGLCTPHTRRGSQSADVPAVARWEGQNRAVDLLCSSCLWHWAHNTMEDALEGETALLPYSLVML